jgi:NADPH:quinone reductase-like Zn-dependent oxidoreductase
MKAAVITRYGSPDVVKILDAPKPTPAAGEVLIRVHAATGRLAHVKAGRIDERIVRIRDNGNIVIAAAN